MQHMKNIFFIAVTASIAFASCGSAENKSNKAEEGAKEEQHEAMAPGAKMDPVCEMEKDETWTEFSVHNNDTTWFCSGGCKQAFEARPEKYLGKG
jgi:YHS domain-containing protein